MRSIVRSRAPVRGWSFAGAAITLAATLAALAFAGALAPRAEGRVAVVGDQLTYPYAQWANVKRFNRMPAPREMIRVEEVESGCSACTWLRDPAVVRIRLPRPGVREAWLHELGHRFDWVEMSGHHRAQFVALMHTGRAKAGEPLDIFDPRWLDRSLGHHSPHEVFADAYKACAGSRWMRLRRGRPKRRVITWSFLAPPGFRERSVVRTCRLIRRAYQPG